MSLVKLMTKAVIPVREKKTVNIEIGRNIQRIREQAGYTQETLSELLSLTPNHLSAIERGVSGISLESLQRFCSLLGVSADTVLFGVVPSNAATQNILFQLGRVDVKYHEAVGKAVSTVVDAILLAEKG